MVKKAHGSVGDEIFITQETSWSSRKVCLHKMLFILCSTIAPALGPGSIVFQKDYKLL